MKCQSLFYIFIFFLRERGITEKSSASASAYLTFILQKNLITLINPKNRYVCFMQNSKKTYQCTCRETVVVERLNI